MGKASRQKSSKRKNDELIEQASKLLDWGIPLEMGIAVVKELAACKPNNPEILISCINREVFVYDLDNPECETPMDSIFETLQRRFPKGVIVSDWMAKALLRQPLKLLKRGYTVYDSDVILLHATIPGADAFISVEKLLQSLIDWAASETARNEEALMQAAIPMPGTHAKSDRLAV